MIDNNKLAHMILDEYSDSALSAELVVYRMNDNQIIRDTITVDFYDDKDYQYQINTKPIYTE